MPYRLIVASIVLLLLLWSFRTPPPAKQLYPLKEVSPPVALATQYEPKQCGTIRGAVTWEGDIPKVEPFALSRTFYTPAGRAPKPNPNRIEVSPKKGLANAVVFLRRVELAKSRPWDQSPVTLEADDLDIQIRQGDRLRRIGFVRQGDEVTLVAKESASHLIRAQGAAHFTQALTEPELPVKRVFAERGIAEISSGGEFIWARAYLFVAEHPYYTLTDSDGRFELQNVPAGDYELVCWKPNWHIAKRDRDPVYVVYSRIEYQPPVERVVRVHVGAGGETQAEPIVFKAEMFAPK